MLYFSGRQNLRFQQCAPTTRAKDKGRDWNDYAQRTARFTYSASGNS